MGPALVQSTQGEPFWPERILRSNVSSTGARLDVLNANIVLTGPGIHPPIPHDQSQSSSGKNIRGIAGSSPPVRETHARGPDKPSSSTGTVAQKVRTPSPKKLPKTKTRPKATPSPSKSPRKSTTRSSDVLSPGQPHWSVVHPPKVAGREDGAASDNPVPSFTSCKPRIWANSQRELFSILPELSKPVNGISWSYSETPVLVLEDGSVWPGDEWDDSHTTFKLSMVRDFTCHKADLLKSKTVQSIQPTSPTKLSLEGDPHHLPLNHEPGPTSSSLPASLQDTLLKEPVEPSLFGVWPSIGTDRGFEKIYQEQNHSGSTLLPISELFSYQYLPHQLEGPACSKFSIPFILGRQEDHHMDDTTQYSPRAVSLGENSAVFNDKMIDVEHDGLSLVYPDSPEIVYRAGIPQNPTSSPIHAFPSHIPPEAHSSTTSKQALSSIDQHSLVPPQPSDPSSSTLPKQHTIPVFPLGTNTSSTPYSQLNLCHVGAPDDDQFMRSNSSDSDSQSTNVYHMGCYDPANGSSALSSHQPSILPPLTTLYNDNGSYTFPPMNLCSSGRLSIPPSCGRSTITGDAPRLFDHTSQVSVNNPAPSAAACGELNLGTPTSVHLKELGIIEPHNSISSPCVSHDMEIEKTLERQMPEEIPTEIQALVDSHACGVPVIVLMSRSCRLLPRPLPPEYGLSYLGIFHIAQLDFERTEPGERQRLSAGRVRWQFRFEWVYGGEESLPDHSPTLTPWWLPLSEGNPAHLPKSNSNHDHRRDLGQYYYRALPRHLFAPFGASCSDHGFPRGWHCVNCGKLNEQIHLRHRKCSHCRPDAPLGIGYALVLSSVREYNQALSTPLPADVYPDEMDSSAVMWADGMRTFSYFIREGVMAKHIYTCNKEALQEEPTLLFRDFQLHVALSRQSGDGSALGLYFTHVAGVGHDNNFAAVPWINTPECVRRARDFLLYRAHEYGECEDISINHLTTLAWVATGTKRGVIEAKTSPVTILCLGSEVVLSIAQKTLDRSVEVDLGASSDSEGEEPTGINGAGPSHAIATPKAKRKVSAAQGRFNQRKGIVRFTLVHGDVLMLSGDDFECSTKRTGTSILVFGRHVSE